MSDERFDELMDWSRDEIVDLVLKLESKLDCAVKALEYYADKDLISTYKLGDDLEGDMTGRTYYGKRARLALGEIKNE